MSDNRSSSRGSWTWALRVSERSALATVAALFVILHAAGDISEAAYRQGLVLVAALLLAVGVLFRVVLPRMRYDRRAAWLGVLVGAGTSVAIYAVLKGEVPSAHLFFLPPIVIAGLLGDLTIACVAGLLALFGYLGVGQLSNAPPGAVPSLLNSTIFLLTGVVSGMLSQELRRHYQREIAEHRLAVAVGHRLTAVVGAIEEAIVFSNRQGTVRMINRRAEELFELSVDEHIDGPAVQLLRVIALKTEDPEGFMETFQALRDDPEQELRWEIEQIIPTRRVLRVLSRPVTSKAGSLVGRIDVYTDVTEGVRRAVELEAAFQEARKTAESYQRGLLPKSPPSLPRLGLVAHYIPAAGSRAVCGDFYDFVTFKDGRVGAIIGDVCGIGPEAVNDAALTRYTLRSLARAESDPGRLLELVNENVSDNLGSERFVRLVFAVFDPERAVLEYTNAGHAPPILFRAKRGNIDRLEEGGLPLGIEEGARYKTARIELDPGDTIFFYTDGVTEAPRRGKPMGQGRLADLVRQYGIGTPGELVQAIRRAVDSWVDDDLRDDMAMLACQVAADIAVATSSRELVLPNEPSRIREVRSFVAEFLADLRAKVDVSAEVLLATGEAAGNAVKYGRREEGRSEIRVRCVLEGTDVIITIADDGPGFEVSPKIEAGLPDPFASGGRGLFLMRQLTDDFSIESSPHGTTVTLVRRTFETPPVP